MGCGRAVFLDRDGTINADRPDYIKSWQEFHFLPHALDALRRLAALELDIIVVTNQSAIGRELLTAQVAADINERMVGEIRRHGGRVSAVYLCPHLPSAGCGCRKPKPGLLQRAAQDHGIDLSRSFMVGDKLSDVAAGQAAGCQAIYITPTSGSEAGGSETGFMVTPNLYEATLHIESALKSPAT
jgi:D-glycero-D-manno-heptose 1,7-bisphosphate phosphatase